MDPRPNNSLNCTFQSSDRGNACGSVEEEEAVAPTPFGLQPDGLRLNSESVNEIYGNPVTIYEIFRKF